MEYIKIIEIAINIILSFIVLFGYFKAKELIDYAKLTSLCIIIITISMLL